MSLLTLVEYKVFAHVTNANADARLQAIIDSAETFFLNQIKRNIESASYAEYYDGTCRNDLMLNQYPVTSVALLKLIDINDLEETIDAADFWFYSSGKLVLKFATFFHGNQNVYVEYTAGFSAVPNDIKMAIAEIVSRKYEGFDKEKGGTVDSESFIGGSIVIRESDLTPYAESVIAFYKKKGKYN